MESKTFKRKIVLVNKKKQFTVLGYFAFMAVLPVLISYCTVRIGINQIMAQMSGHAFMGHYTFQSLMQQQLALFTWQTLILILMIVGTFLLAGVYMTHRIFGPIYHLRVYMRQVIEGGESRQVHFRKGDFFKDLERDFNQFQDHLKK